MSESKKWLLLFGLLCVMLSGCTDIRQSLLLEKRPAVTPTEAPLEPSVTTVSPPEPTVTVTLTPTPTLSPSPTPTPAPKKIGTKENSAGSMYVINNTGKRFRSLQVRAAYSEDWGRNLISSDSSILPGEDFYLYYPASDTDHQLRLIDTDRNEYIMYSQNLSDMQNASLLLDGSGDAYFSYTSKTDQSQRDTNGYSYTEDYYGSYNTTGGTGTGSGSSADSPASGSRTGSGTSRNEDDEDLFTIYSESTYSSEDDGYGYGNSDYDSDDEYWDYIG